MPLLLCIGVILSVARIAVSWQSMDVLRDIIYLQFIQWAFPLPTLSLLD